MVRLLQGFTCVDFTALGMVTGRVGVSAVQGG